VQRIFVGDIQGCADELEEVLTRARREFGRDYELWCVGDVVNRGPKSHRALALVREHVEAGRGRVVLGNHDIALLTRWLGLREPRPADTMEDLLERPDVDEWCDWLRRQPLAVAGALGGAGAPFLLVHAAVHPKWSREDALAAARPLEKKLGADDRDDVRRFLAKRDDTLGRMISCRSVLPNGAWSKRPPEDLDADAEPWHAAWRRRKPGYGIVYGHWSLQRLHVASGLRGLDTGCVHHNRDRDGFLTAWLPDGNAKRPFAIPDERFWHVRARRRYYLGPD